MKDFDLLVDIWKTQKTTPDLKYEAVITSLKKTKNKFKLKVILGLLAMVMGVVFMVTIWVKTNFVYLTTHISISIFVLCCLYYMATQFKNLKILSHNNYTLSPQKHLTQMLAFKQMRYRQNTKNYFFYSLALGLGLGLFFIEFFSKVNSTVIYVSLAFTILWFALTYFYMHKIYLKREDKLFSEIIHDLDRIKNQFDEERE